VNKFCRLCQREIDTQWRMETRENVRTCRDCFFRYDMREVKGTDGSEGGVTRIELASILSQRTKEGKVELAVNEVQIQMDLDKAREVLSMLSHAIEAAVSDQLLYAFLTTRVGLKDDQASRALLDFRELRQGSKATVYPV
jgi:hypothetical protein